MQTDCLGKVSKQGGRVLHVMRNVNNLFQITYLPTKLIDCELNLRYNCFEKMPCNLPTFKGKSFYKNVFCYFYDSNMIGIKFLEILQTVFFLLKTEINTQFCTINRAEMSAKQNVVEIGCCDEPKFLFLKFCIFWKKLNMKMIMELIDQFKKLGA